jgi:hypothetical protein
MLTRITLILPATIAAWLATSCLSLETSHAASDCLAKPNALAPQGAHWYYRVDRATQRQCWYLAAEGFRAVQPRAPQSASRAPAVHPNAIAQTRIAQTREEPFVATISSAEPRNESPNETVEPVQGHAPTTLSQPSSGFSKSAVAFDPAPSTVRSYAQEQPSAASVDDMPLVWPILTPAELADSRPPQSHASVAELAIMLIAVVGLAGFLVYALALFTSARKAKRTHAPARHADLREIMARPPARPTRNRAAATEASVQRLLHELRRRQQGYRDRDFQRRAAAPA